jgi:hypothetical protein
MNVKCGLVAFAAVVLLVACGQSSSQTGAVDVYRDFARAAAERNGDDLWALISERMKAQVSREEFTAPSVLGHLRNDYAPVAGGPVALAVELEDDLTLVALEGDGRGPGAQAAIMRLEDGEWRVQLTELDLGFGSGEREVTVNARSEDRDSIKTRAWIDGREALVKRGKDTYAPTFQVTPKDKLRGGQHGVVAYVEAGERSGAIAWTFGR